MPIYRVQGPDGKVHKVEGPEGASPQEVEAFAARSIDTGGAEAKAGGFRHDFTDHMLQSAIPFLDEIGAAGTRPVAAVRAAISGEDDPKAQPYYDRLSEIRGASDQYASEKPVLSTIANVAGGVASAPLAGGAGKTLAGNVARAGAEGGVYGFSEGRGSIEDRLTNMLVTGSVSALMPISFEALRGSGRAIKNVFKAPTGRAAEKKASDQVALALSRDNVNVGSLDAPHGKPVTLADVAGERTRKKAAAAANMPNAQSDEAMGFLAGRRGEQVSRITDDLTAGTGIAPGNRYAMVDEISENMRKQAAPLYEAAYEASDAIDDPRILDLLDVPDVQRAFSAAVKIFENEKAANIALGRNMEGLVPIIERQGGKIVKTGLFPDMRTADYMKRALDDQISALYRKGQGGRAGALKEVRNVLVERLDDISPEYRQARAVWSGGSEALESADLAKKFMNMSPDDLDVRWGNMSEAEREVFRHGAISQVSEHLGRFSDNHDMVNKMVKAPNMRRKLRILFPDDQSFDTFIQRMGVEEVMAKTENAALVGSRTTPMAAEMAEITGDVPVTAADAAGAIGGDLQSLVRSGMRVGGKAVDRVRGNNPEVAQNILNLTLRKLTPEQQRIVATALQERGEEATQDLIRRLLLDRLGAGVAGRLVSE